MVRAKSHILLALEKPIYSHFRMIAQTSRYEVHVPTEHKYYFTVIRNVSSSYEVQEKTYEMREQFYSGLDDESFLWAQQIADANDLDFGGPDGPDTD